MILKKLTVGPFAANCYIVGAESNKEGMVIDPGANAREILNSIRHLGLNIEFIVLTHGHTDHISAVKKVKEVTGAEVAIHTDEARALRWLSPSTLYNLSPPPPPDRLLQDGDSLDIGDLHFSVLHTPGHSPGGICLLGHGVLFSGDTLLSRLMNSIYGKLMALPDDTIVYPGHGPDTTIGTERQKSPPAHLIQGLE